MAKLELLDKYWNDEGSDEVDNVQISNNGHTLNLEIGTSYLFVHSEIRKKAFRTLDDYWKGTVEGIKIHPTLPPGTNILLSVRWFWSKRDIQQCIKGTSLASGNLSKFLTAMAKQELCASNTVSIESHSSVEDIVDIVMLQDGENQPPITAYFYRLLWNDQTYEMHGDQPFGCGIEKCKRAWAPDREEQRYCFICRCWYHATCLGSATKLTQDQQVELMTSSSNHGPLPTVLLEAAFQPVARGGERHFIAGNIRIVSYARSLVEDEGRRDLVTGGQTLSGEKWMELLEAEFGITSEGLERDGDEWSEQLIVGNQAIYTCPRCTNVNI